MAFQLVHKSVTLNDHRMA